MDNRQDNKAQDTQEYGSIASTNPTRRWLSTREIEDAILLLQDQTVFKGGDVVQIRDTARYYDGALKGRPFFVVGEPLTTLLNQRYYPVSERYVRLTDGQRSYVIDRADLVHVTPRVYEGYTRDELINMLTQRHAAEAQARAEDIERQRKRVLVERFKPGTFVEFTVGASLKRGIVLGGDVLLNYKKVVYYGPTTEVVVTDGQFTYAKNYADLRLV